MKRDRNRFKKNKLGLAISCRCNVFLFRLTAATFLLPLLALVACQSITPSITVTPTATVTLVKPAPSLFEALVDNDDLPKDGIVLDKNETLTEAYALQLDSKEAGIRTSVSNARMDSIIWQFEADEQEIGTINPVSPRSKEPTLTEDALEDAFAFLSGRVKPQIHGPAYQVRPKSDGIVRVGLLVPLSGKYMSLGTEIRRSVEMALFTINNPKIEVLFLDTKAGEEAGNAVMVGVESGVDIFIGPLFTKAVVHARAVTDQIRNSQEMPPMLLLSNNVDVAEANSWLMGYLPEQQLDGLLGHAISKGKRKFALIAQDTIFGQRLLAHANKRLGDLGLVPEALRVLSDKDLGDENALKTTIRNFTRYSPAVDGELLAESPFDAVVFAGDPAFALRTAPVLAYYDVGPDRALYLGNALWNQSQVLVEPSLQGGLFSMRPSNLDSHFDSNWNKIWSDPSGQLARIGFDAMALVSALTKSEDKDWAKQLVSNSGFQGYSGAFRLLTNGRNMRSFELRKIENGEAKIIKLAPNKI